MNTDSEKSKVIIIAISVLLAVVGLVAIAVGVYFGLKNKSPPDVPPTPSPTSPTGASGTASPTGASGGVSFSNKAIGPVSDTSVVLYGLQVGLVAGAKPASTNNTSASIFWSSDGNGILKTGTTCAQAKNEVGASGDLIDMAPCDAQNPRQTNWNIKATNTLDSSTGGPIEYQDANGTIWCVTPQTNYTLQNNAPAPRLAIKPCVASDATQKFVRYNAVNNQLV